MIPSKSTALICAVLFLSTVSGSFGQQSYSLSGYIHDPVLGQALSGATVQVRTEVDTLELTTDTSGYYEGSIVLSGVDRGAIPKNYGLLSQNYPNPASPATTIRFRRPGTVELFSLTGRRIFRRELTRAATETPDLAAGLYFYRFTSADAAPITRKMAVLDGGRIEIRFLPYAMPGRASAAKTAGELAAKYYIEKADYTPFDTLITLHSDGDNRHDFRLRRRNYPPTTTVPKLTLPNRGTRQLDLNPYVTDPDNNPEDMTWQATEYDTTLLNIVIDSLNTATITSKGTTGTTQILWTATGPEGAKGQNQSTTQIKPSYLLTLQTWDPINKGTWPNDTLIVITPYGKKQIITDSNGTATTYVTSDTGRVLVPLNTRHYETQQPYKKPTQDGKLTIPITGIEFPIGDFVTFQGGTPAYQYVYITRWDPRYINKAKNPEDPDTLRYAYIEPDTLESEKKYIGHYQTLKDTIESWNEWLFPRMTGGRLVITPLDMDKNVQFYGPKSRDDEIAKRIELMDTTKALPDSAGAFQLVTYYGLTISSLVQDRPGEPDSSLHYAKRGGSIVSHHAGPGWWLEEIVNTMVAMHGEGDGRWERTAVYGGHAQWPPFVEYWPYREEEIAGEEIIGNFKFRHPVHTLVRREGIIILPPKTPAYR